MKLEMKSRGLLFLVIIAALLISVACPHRKDASSDGPRPLTPTERILIGIGLESIASGMDAGADGAETFDECVAFRTFAGVIHVGSDAVQSSATDAPSIGGQPIDASSCLGLPGAPDPGAVPAVIVTTVSNINAYTDVVFSDFGDRLTCAEAAWLRAVLTYIVDGGSEALAQAAAPEPTGVITPAAVQVDLSGCATE